MERLAYSPREAGEAIGVGRTKVYELMADGSLPSKKLGARRLILASDLVAFLADLESSDR